VSGPRHREVRVGGCLAATLEPRVDGTALMRSTEPLGPYPARLADRLAHWAGVAPDRVFAARRDPAVTGGGAWITITFAQMLARAQAVGEWMVAHGLSAERPLAILSDNDLEHLTLAMGGLWAGVPVVPVSPAYSLLSQDHAKLRHIAAVTTPGAVFAASPAFAPAIAAIDAPGLHVVLGQGTLPGRPSTPFAELPATVPGAAVAAAHAATGPDTIVKFLFTSGSTLAPKGVVNTNRMLCANQQMVAQAMAFVADPDEPPVLVDWLPWNHTFGGNQNVGICLYNGGTLYIDEGKPTARGIATTIRNLREISPTVYFNVPKGFEELTLAMEGDTALRESLFRRVKAFMFAGAGLAQAVWDRLDRQAEATVGERIRIVTGLGMTETAPACLFVVEPGAGAGHVGRPCPGVEVKLVPDAQGSGKTEVRFRGPNVMPGYWRAPEQTRDAFDEEGFYRTGDAVAFIDPAEPTRGLVFDGRIAEDFKLSTGTFVSVGPLRAKVIAAGSPLVQDAVVAGIDRDELGLLIFPRLEDIRARFGLPLAMPAEAVLAEPSVRAFFQELLDRLWAAGTGSATRPARLLVMAEPPHIDRGEVTDKGSINQRAVLAHRAALVAALYTDDAPGVLRPGGRG
jgi:feruloyl-CoA synthase